MIPTKHDVIRAIIVVLVIFVLGSLIYLRNAGAEIMYVNVSESSWLNGRARPNMDSEVLCRFMRGDSVDVLDIQDGWAKIEEGGEAQYSYVSLKYLTSEATGETKMRVVSDGRVLVRKKPGGEVKGYVRDGDLVTVSFFYDGWAKTDRGWIDSGYLR